MRTNTLIKNTSGDALASMDGKIIYRKSLFTARVYDPKDCTKFIEYPSRLAHCGSCLTDAEYGAGMDECCCIHAEFPSKKQENEWVKSIGFWKLAGGTPNAR